MIFELNPFKWGKKPLPAPPVRPLISEFSPTHVAIHMNYEETKEFASLLNIPAVQPVAPVEKTMSNSFVSFLDAVGRDFMKGLQFIVKYIVPVETLAEFIFPKAVAPLTAAQETATILQNTVLTVEQNYAAAGVQNGTGAQKAAAVLSLSEAAVTKLLSDPTVSAELSKVGITVSSDYINNLISGVVAILNLQTAPAA